MHDIRVFKAAHHMGDRISFADVGENWLPSLAFDAHTSPAISTTRRPRNHLRLAVPRPRQPIIRDFDDADIGSMVKRIIFRAMPALVSALEASTCRH
jgi:hypothetical protein